ncbi:hypothetical protein [Staphylospora marina]|uniref:hypothetical protein n=1 Tax=Staphylospora marina TaxID=2490858 RepID=UPI000F5C1A1F|nr:hypothetical protein [Staphylospora marina]
MGKKRTETKQWILRLNGRETEIRAEWQENGGTLTVDGKEMEKWESVWNHLNVRRTVRVGDHRVVLHLSKETEYEEFVADLSVDAISVTTGRKVEELRPTPVYGIDKVWNIRLSDGEHEVRLKHARTKVELQFDGQLMERCHVWSGSTDLPMRIGDHRIHARIRQVEDGQYLYQLIVDGLDQDSLQSVDPVSTTPPDQLRFRAWHVTRGERIHRVEVHFGALGRSFKVSVDGRPETAVGGLFKESVNCIPVRIGDSECFICVRDTFDEKKECDLVVDGRFFTTGDPVGHLLQRRADGIRSWTVELDGASREIGIDAGRLETKILLDGEVVHRRTWRDVLAGYTWNEIHYEWFPLPLGTGESGVLLDHRMGRSWRLYVNGTDVETGKRLESLKALTSGGNIIWLFRDSDGALQQVVLKTRWFRHSIVVNGNVVGELNSWKDREKTFRVGAWEARLILDDSFADIELKILDQSVQTGKPVEVSEDSAKPPTETGWKDRITEALIGVFLSFALWLGWKLIGSPERGSGVFLLPIVYVLPRLFGVTTLRGTVFFFAGLFALFFGGSYVYFEWIEPLMAD